MVDLVHFSESGKMQISPKLEHYRANQYHIQRPRLRKNRQLLNRKAATERANVVVPKRGVY